MKKIILSLSLLGVFMMANAQIDKKKTLERLRSELLPQTKDYNPYQYTRERHILDLLDVRISYETTDYCEVAKEMIERFYEVASTTSDEDKSEFINDISLYQCQETYNFLETQIKNNPSETVCCKAIVSLAWLLNLDYLPCILEYAKRDSLSIQEKLAIAEAYAVLGIYTSYSDLKEEAIKLLDEICYNSSSDEFLESSCGWTYYKLGGKPAINYHIFLIEQIEEYKELRRKVAIAAYSLAPLGEYETTFPIFVEAIHSGIPHNILCAISGLRIVGTEEALRLIEEQAHSKDEKIARKVQETVRKIDKKGREE